MKKILLSIGAAASIVAPVAAVVSCGNQEVLHNWEAEIKESVGNGWSVTDWKVDSNGRGKYHIDYVLTVKLKSKSGQPKVISKDLGILYDSDMPALSNFETWLEEQKELSGGE